MHHNSEIIKLIPKVILKFYHLQLQKMNAELTTISYRSVLNNMCFQVAFIT